MWFVVLLPLIASIRCASLASLSSNYGDVARWQRVESGSCCTCMYANNNFQVQFKSAPCECFIRSVDRFDIRSGRVSVIIPSIGNYRGGATYFFRVVQLANAASLAFAATSSSVSNFVSSFNSAMSTTAYAPGPGVWGLEVNGGTLRTLSGASAMSLATESTFVIPVNTFSDAQIEIGFKVTSAVSAGIGIGGMVGLDISPPPTSAARPTPSPTPLPTIQPTPQPSPRPSPQPTPQPTTTQQPTPQPTTTLQPTPQPTPQASTSTRAPASSTGGTFRTPTTTTLSTTEPLPVTTATTTITTSTTSTTSTTTTTQHLASPSPTTSTSSASDLPSQTEAISGGDSSTGSTIVPIDIESTMSTMAPMGDVTWGLWVAIAAAICCCLMFLIAAALLLQRRRRRRVVNVKQNPYELQTTSTLSLPDSSSSTPQRREHIYSNATPSVRTTDTSLFGGAPTAPPVQSNYVIVPHTLEGSGVTIPGVLPSDYGEAAPQAPNYGVAPRSPAPYGFVRPTSASVNYEAATTPL